MIFHDSVAVGNSVARSRRPSHTVGLLGVFFGRDRSQAHRIRLRKTPVAEAPVEEIT